MSQMLIEEVGEDGWPPDFDAGALTIHLLPVVVNFNNDSDSKNSLRMRSANSDSDNTYCGREPSLAAALDN